MKRTLALLSGSLTITVLAYGAAYTVTDLGTLGGDLSLGSSINNNGQVTGFSTTAQAQFHAFLYSNGVMQDLGTLPGDTSSFGSSINDNGQVTGSSRDAGGRASRSHAFLYSNGVMQDLGTFPGGRSSEGNGINSNG